MPDPNTKTPELDTYLFKARDAISSTPTNLPLVKSALIELLSFLASPSGRTHENCSAADTFFLLHDDYGFNWYHLPEEYQLILEDIGGRLHDTIEHPEIATNFESTPEQLLERVFELLC